MPVTSELAPIRRPHTVHGRSFDADFELTRLAKRGKRRSQAGCDRFLIWKDRVKFQDYSLADIPRWDSII